MVQYAFPRRSSVFPISRQEVIYLAKDTRQLHRPELWALICGLDLLSRFIKSQHRRPSVHPPIGVRPRQKRVNPILDEGKQQSHRLGSTPTSNKAFWPITLKFGPGMLTETTVVLEIEALGRKGHRKSVAQFVDRNTASAVIQQTPSTRQHKANRVCRLDPRAPVGDIGNEEEHHPMHARRLISKANRILSRQLSVREPQRKREPQGLKTRNSPP